MSKTSHKYVVYFRPTWYAPYRFLGETWAKSEAQAISRIKYRNKEYDLNYEYKCEMVAW